MAGLAATVAVNPIAQSLAAPTTISATPVAVTTKSTAAVTTATKTKRASGNGSATPMATRTITGDAVQERYGTVQVELTVKGKTITNVQVLQAPGGSNQQFADYAVPVLTQEVLQAQSANVNVVSGASFISGGFLQSVASAIAKM